MRFTRVGLDADGRSAVAESRDCDFALYEPGGLGVDTLWETFQNPVELPVARRARDDQWLDLHVKPGGSRWAMWKIAPNTPGHFHHTSTMDYQTVIAGQVTLELQNGEVLLRPGDSILIPGLEHSWITGSEGCTLCGVVFGLPETA